MPFFVLRGFFYSIGNVQDARYVNAKAEYTHCKNGRFHHHRHRITPFFHQNHASTLDRRRPAFQFWSRNSEQAAPRTQAEAEMHVFRPDWGRIETNLIQVRTVVIPRLALIGSNRSVGRFTKSPYILEETHGKN